MANGLFQRCNGSRWTNTVQKKCNGSVWSDGRIRHCDGSNWYDKYPNKTTEEKYFNVVWTHAANKNGIMLDAATWGDHPRAGDTVGFTGFFGFDRPAMQAFVGTSTILSIQLELLFIDPSHAGNPLCEFYPHVYLSKPTGFETRRVFKEHMTTSKFNQTGTNILRWIHMPVSAWMGGDMGGIAVGAAWTAANSARFAGKTSSHGVSAFNSRLYIKVQR